MGLCSEWSLQGMCDEDTEISKVSPATISHTDLDSASSPREYIRNHSQASMFWLRDCKIPSINIELHYPLSFSTCE